MIEMILGTYGVLCWLLFKKFRLIPVNAYTVSTAILGGVALAAFILVMLALFHPASKDGRLYAFTTPVVAQVKGRVIETLMEGQTVKKGDMLFKVDPEPYQVEVDRLEAALANAKSAAAQLKEQLKAAESATSQARSQLLTAESEYNRQAQEDVTRAKTAAEGAKSRYDLARIEMERQSELIAKKLVSQSEFDILKTKYDGAESAFKESQSELRQALESVKAGSDKVQTAREQLNIAEAQERSSRLAAEAEIEGVNPQVRQMMADLDDKRWNLEQSVVRAPADGYVTQVMLRPGQMVVSMPLSPAMVFVHAEKMVLMASFPQNVITNLKPGLECELAFKAKPGQIYNAKLTRILPVTAEGQLQAGGQLRALTAYSAPARIPVAFEYEKAVEDLHLPGGAQATVAVYTEHVHALSIIRKILVRIKSWENYLFLP